MPAIARFRSAGPKPRTKAKPRLMPRFKRKPVSVPADATSRGLSGRGRHETLWQNAGYARRKIGEETC